MNSSIATANGLQKRRSKAKMGESFGNLDCFSAKGLEDGERLADDYRNEKYKGRRRNKEDV